ncbi:MAG: type 4a pilus biogenesis protein PilO [Oxalobacteraceae bacterium]|nr:type 4a pilus biogenesis protein PilO [Oxalobacteraceae bacterium]
MADLKRVMDSLKAQFQGLDGQQPGQWPLAPRLLCGVGVLFAVLVLGWYFYWSDQIAALDAGVQQEQKLRDEYRSKIAQAMNLDSLRKQKELVGQYVATLEKQLPNKAEMDALLSDINQAGIGRGLQFELFKPGQVAVNDYYAELPINIKVVGSYHDVGAFTSDIANLPRIVTLNSMNLVAAKDGVLSLEAIAKTFRYLDPEEVAAQRKLATDKKGGKK